MKTTHDLKVHPQFWASLVKRDKTFEVRRDDRNFRIGDMLRLREWNPQHGYTGQEELRQVTYILRNEDLPQGVPVGWCVMGLWCARCLGV